MNDSQADIKHNKSNLSLPLLNSTLFTCIIEQTNPSTHSLISNPESLFHMIPHNSTQVSRDKTLNLLPIQPYENVHKQKYLVMIYIYNPVKHHALIHEREGRSI